MSPVDAKASVKNFEEARKLLLAAAQKIDTGLLTLDLTSDECECCGRKNYRNWPHARIYDRMSNKPEHLKQIAAQCDEMIDRLNGIEPKRK